MDYAMTLTAEVFTLPLIAMHKSRSKVPAECVHIQQAFHIVWIDGKLCSEASTFTKKAGFLAYRSSLNVPSHTTVQWIIRFAP